MFPQNFCESFNGTDKTQIVSLILKDKIKIPSAEAGFLQWGNLDLTRNFGNAWRLNQLSETGAESRWMLLAPSGERPEIPLNIIHCKAQAILQKINI